MELDCGSTLLMILTEDGLQVHHVPSDPMERLAWAGKGLFSDEDPDEWLRALREEWDD